MTWLWHDIRYRQEPSHVTPWQTSLTLVWSWNFSAFLIAKFNLFILSNDKMGRSIFILLAVVGSQICEIARNSERIRTYSRSRSSTVIDLGVTRKCICDFLLVISSNFGRISYPTVFEILTFKSRKWLFPPSLVWCPRLGNASEFLYENYHAKIREIRLSYGGNFIILTSTVFDWSTRVTDGQTDRQTDRPTGDSIIALGML